MNKTKAMKTALEQAFWVKYPSLQNDGQYTFDELFPTIKTSIYQDVFWQLVESNELPLIPVIPLQNNGVVNQVALDYHE
jgi:hypothetical protein